MSRINTNVSSLIAQKTLARSNAQLQESLTRLSTGLRINVGKDDPAGLIASEALRSDIIGVEKAITNSERANQLISTADSALGQVSQLLNDIRGLVSEAANVGALSDEQIAANQLQVDSSLEAIDRIAQITSFQGKRLLDGSLDFITSGVSSDVSRLQIDQANFGQTSSIGVSINISQQATRASLNYAFGAIAEQVSLEVGGARGTEAFNFDTGSTIEEIATAVNQVSDSTGVEAVVENDAAAGELIVSSFGADNDVVITANNKGFDEGDIRVKYSQGTSTSTNVTYTAAQSGQPGTIDVALGVSEAVGAAGTNLDDGNLTQTNAAYTIAFNDIYGSTPTDVTVTAASAGSSLHGVTFEFEHDESLTTGSDKAVASFDANNKVVTVRIDAGTTTATEVKDAIDGLSQFTASGGSADAVGAYGHTTTQTTQGVGGSNNTLDVTANITGTDFNGVDVHFVAGKTNEAGTSTELVQRKTTFYGTKTDAVFKNDFSIAVKDDSAVYKGANGGDITINFTDDDGGDQLVDFAFNAVSGELTVTGDFSADTALTAADIKSQLEASAATFTADGVTHNIKDVFGASLEGSDGTHVVAVGATAAFVTNQDNDVLGSNAATQASHEILVDADDANTAVTLTAVAGSKYDGAYGNKVKVTIADDAGIAAPTFEFDEAAGTLTVTGDFTAGVTNAALDTAFAAAVTDEGNKLSDYFALQADAATYVIADDNGDYLSAGVQGTGDAGATAAAGYNEVEIDYSHAGKAAQAALNGFNASSDSALVLTAATEGTEFNDVEIKFVHDAGLTGNPTAQFIAASEGTPAKLEVTVKTGTTTFAQIAQAINDEGTFTAAADTSVDTGNDLSGIIHANDVTGGTAPVVGNTKNTGGDAGTLFVYIEDGVTTAADVVSALENSGNERAKALFTIENSADSDGSGELFANTLTGALSGGQDGGEIIATAQQVVDAINASGANVDVTAAVAEGDTGLGVVTAFDHFASSGTAALNNELQFLGSASSPKVRFTSTAGTDLSATTEGRVEGRSLGTLAAQNADASLQFRAVNDGEDYDDTVVRFQAAKAGSQNTVTYDRRESAAEAVIQFGNDSNDYADIRITANTRGADFNDVTIILEEDSSLTGDEASVTYDAEAKTLTIGVEATSTQASTILAAINDEGTFTAATDYADNSTADLSQNDYTVVAGDLSAALTTTAHGGHKGGTLEFTIANGSTTAQDVIELLSGDDYATSYFQGINFGSSGSGNIDVRADSNQAVTSGGLEDAGTLVVDLATNADGVISTTANDLLAYFDNADNAAVLSDLDISVTGGQGSDGSGLLEVTEDYAAPGYAGENDVTFAKTGQTAVAGNATGTVTAVKGINAQFTVTADEAGADFDDVTIVLDGSLSTAGNEVASYNADTKTLTVSVKSGVNASSANQVIAAINRDLDGAFTAETVAGGDGSGDVTTDDTGTLSGGLTYTGEIQGAALQGNADLKDGGLTFRATNYGSDAHVQVKALSGSFDVTDATGAKVDRSSGTDIDVRINGIQAISDGLSASINTASLDLSFSIDSSASSGSEYSFEITGGGALFQIGPDVVSNQQARLGIQSVSTSTLGGVSGRLYELRSGGTKSLANNATQAANVVDEAISGVTSLRGRLGAFQRTTLETNIYTLNDTLANLTEAESSIRDADFAVESARLTRAQILVQSGTSVLGIANQNPQNVLSLLR